MATVTMTRADALAVLLILIALTATHIAPAVAGETETLTVDTDAGSYPRDATVTITGILANSSGGISGETIGISVEDSLGIILFTDNPTTNQSGCYATDFTIPSSASTGTATIYAAHGTAHSNATFTITSEDTTPPEIQNVTVSRSVLPEDTDGSPAWGETSNVSVTATDTGGIAAVTVNLAPLGWSIAPMHPGAAGCWHRIVNASVGTATWNGSTGQYDPLNLVINVTDTAGNWNTTSVALTIWKNGDISGNGDVNLYDTSYLAKHLLGQPAYASLADSVADVSGNGDVNLYDTSYLAKHLLGTQGYGVLH